MKSHKALGAALLTITASAGLGQTNPLDFLDMLVSGEFGYILAPPVVVSQAVVQEFSWSSDGQLLLYVAEEPPSATAITEAIDNSRIHPRHWRKGSGVCGLERALGQRPVIDLVSGR